LTTSHYINSWNWLELFMAEHSLHLEDFGPTQAELYLTWRCADRRPADAHRHRSGHRVHRNSALRDIKFLKWIHRQGRLLGKCQTTALNDYAIKPSARIRIFPTFSPAQIETVRGALSHPVVPKWMGISWEIGLATGCRLRETAIPLEGVDLVAGTITFPTPKGGPKMAFTIPIPKAIVPLLCDLKASGAKVSCEIPPKASHYWRQLFNRIGMRTHVFHSLRVTRVTNLRKAGVPQSYAMRLVNHSSAMVHQLYQRHEVEDLREYVDCGSSRPMIPARMETPDRELGENRVSQKVFGRTNMKQNTPIGTP
jgi:integrase